MECFLAFPLAILLAAPSNLIAQTPQNVHKIRGDVYLHQQLKGPAPGRTFEQRRERARAFRLDVDDLGREEVAIYVKDRLTASEIQELRDKGVDIASETWVAPVGNHQLGFHLADVPYDLIGLLETDDRVVRVDSIEVRSRPLNDVGGALIHVDDVHSGNGVVTARTGAGVKIAIADSGLDVNHPDVPTPVEAFDMTDGTGIGSWGTNVANMVSNHGSHVTGIAVGDGGLSGGKYVGAAPGATLYFYKIGNDDSASASTTDQIEAINRAVDVNADIFSTSYGGLSLFMDGSEAMEQAIDLAVASGTAVFVAAGNEAAKSKHWSGTVAPASGSPTFGFTIDNTNGATGTQLQIVQVIWVDDQPGDNNVHLTCTNLDVGEALGQVYFETSPRSTESAGYLLSSNVAPGQVRTYDFVLNNAAASGQAPLVHCYTQAADGTFDMADPAFTVTSPAVADGAIAVAAWVHRIWWQDYNGVLQFSAQAYGKRASFSSIGPRIDGHQKPDMAAPGSTTISLLDGGLLIEPVQGSNIIDNDGLNLNGTGPADYAVDGGTSMACPMAAGVAALVLEANGSLEPVELRAVLAATASRSSSPDFLVGYGLIDALAAVQPIVWVDFSYSGFQQGSFVHPVNSLANAQAAAIWGANVIIKASGGATAEAPTIDHAMTIKSFGGGVVVGH